MVDTFFHTRSDEILAVGCTLLLLTVLCVLEPSSYDNNVRHGWYISFSLVSHETWRDLGHGVVFCFSRPFLRYTNHLCATKTKAVGSKSCIVLHKFCFNRDRLFVLTVVMYPPVLPYPGVGQAILLLQLLKNGSQDE